jgi:hypothetical protein
MPAQSYFRSMIRLASLLLLVLMTRAIAFAQQDTEMLITVSGPWAYMKDPNHTGRIIIMAPDLTGNGHLKVQIHPAPDAKANPSATPSLDDGQYQLDIANPAVQCDRRDVQGAEVKALLFPLKQHFPQPDQDHLTQAIQTALQAKGKRVAFSLPEPCYYSTWQTSFSIISENPISAPSTGEQDAEGQAFTTEMVLHYFVTAIAPATLTSMPDVGPQSTLPVEFPLNKIEIDLRSDNSLRNSSRCDGMSADSFREEITPFIPSSSVVHLWFPELVGGFQPGNKGHYHADCIDLAMMTANIAKIQKQSAANALASINALKAYVKHPVPGQEKIIEKHLTTIQSSLASLQAAGAKGAMPHTADFLKANQEVEAARKAIASKKRLTQKDFEFSNSRKFIVNASPGSADCQGGQGSVDGTGT